MIGTTLSSEFLIQRRHFLHSRLLIGMTICSIYVASIATEVMGIEHPLTPEVQGHTVGALEGRPIDMLLIAQEGGVALKMGYDDITIGLIKLLEMMKAGDIDGIMLSRMTYYYCMKRARNLERYRKLMPQLNTKLTEMKLRGDDLVGGMVMKRWEDYNFFKRYFEINWAHLQGCYTFDANAQQLDNQESEYNILHGMFHPFLNASLGVLGLIAMFGVVFEIQRRKLCRTLNQQDDFDATKEILSTSK